MKPGESNLTRWPLSPSAVPQPQNKPESNANVRRFPVTRFTAGMEAQRVKSTPRQQSR
jgi:hypothetical protein